MGTIEGGRARLAFSRPDGNPTSTAAGPVVVVGQLETLPWLALVAQLKDDYRVRFDAITLLTTDAHSVERTRGVVERDLTSTFTPRRAIQISTTAGGVRRVERALPAPARDPLGALMVLRAAPLADGTSLSLLVLDRARLWRTRVKAHRERFIPHPSGGAAKPAVNAIRLDGENLQADGPPTHRLTRHFRLWLSDDARRVLLRMEADTDLGTAAVELSSYSPGAQATTCPVSPLPGVN